MVSPVEGNDALTKLNLINGLSAACTKAGQFGSALLKIEPGLYNLGSDALQTCANVDIEGSGEHSTRIASSR